MAVGILTNKQNIKPLFGTRLDYGAALARGIVWCVPYSEGAGNPTEVTAGKTSTSSGTLPWMYEKSGPAVKYVNPGTPTFMIGSTFANHPNFSIASPMTIGFICTPTSWTGSNVLCSNSGNFDLTYNNFHGQGNDWFSCEYWDGAGNVQRRGLASASLPTAGLQHSIVATISGTTPQAIYFDGISQSTSTNSGSSTRVTTNTLNIGNSGGGNQDAFNGPISLFVLWNRALTATEIAQWHRNPWQIFAPRQTYFNAVNTFSSTITAATATMAGTNTKSTGKLTTGTTATMSATTTRQTSKSFPATLATMAGAVSRQTIRVLSAVMAACAGGITKSTTTSKTATTTAMSASFTRMTAKQVVAVTATFVGGATRQTSRVLSGIMSACSGALTKSTGLSRAALMSAMNGAVTRITNNKQTATTGAMSANISRITAKQIIAATVGFAGNATKGIGKALNAITAAFSGLLASVYHRHVFPQPGRTIHVRAESRTFSTFPDSRTFRIGAESRTVRVPRGHQ